MKRITRTTLAAVATLAATVAGIAAPGTVSAASGETVYIDGVAYEDGGVVQIGDGDDSNNNTTDALDAALDTLLSAAKPVSCVPKTATTTIYDPSAHVYYGALDTIYVWESLAEAEITGCPENVVTVKAKLHDQALDGSSLPADGEDATGSGKARAGAVADLMQRYNNLMMSTGLSYHQLTSTVTATQTDGRTTTAWCATKSWTYIATLAGPQMVGETPTEKAKCGA